MRAPGLLRVTLAGCAGLLLGSTFASAQAVPPGFDSGTIEANGLHYVRGGHGPAVLLVHGFPEDWAEYRAIMPTLAKRFTVVAVDLPGIGESSPSSGGYDAPTLAAEIHTLATSLKLERFYLVGHDLGGIRQLRLHTPLSG